MKNIIKLIFFIIAISIILISCLDSEKENNEALKITNETENNKDKSKDIDYNQIEEIIASAKPDAGESESGIEKNTEEDEDEDDNLSENASLDTNLESTSLDSTKDVINPNIQKESTTDNENDENENQTINQDLDKPENEIEQVQNLDSEDNNQNTTDTDKEEEKKYEEKVYTDMVITQDTLIQDKDRMIKDKKIKETYLDKDMSTYITDDEGNYTIIDDFHIKMKEGWQELNYNIIEQSQFAISLKPTYEAFSSKDIFNNFYNKLKGLPPTNKPSSGINFDYNIAVCVTMGEKYLTGYKIAVRKIIFTGKSILVYYTELKPEASVHRRETVSNPYCIAAIYDDKNLREKAKVISFYNTNTNKMSMSVPIVKTRRYPNFEIPEQVRTIQVEQGDYSNFKEEGYYAFNSHFQFESVYHKLKENDRYKVRPPELSFLGNIVILLTLGEKKNGGHKIIANGSFTTAYMLGDDMYVMVRKREPTEKNIRYYDITQPYSLASIQVGIRWKYIRNVYFLNEQTGDELGEVNLGKARW